MVLIISSLNVQKEKKNFNVVFFVSHGIFKFKDAKIQEQLSY